LLTILWTFPRIARASAGRRGAGASRVAAERLRQAILRETEEALRVPVNAKEEQTRKALADGQLGLDLYGLRAKLAALDVEWVSAEDEADTHG
jgi:hypothetical protein